MTSGSGATPSIRSSGRNTRPACGTSARNARHSASDSKCCNWDPNATTSYPSVRTSQAGAVGKAGRTDALAARFARAAPGAGKCPARHNATKRSNRAPIRAIRPQTATNNTVKARSRAARAAITARRSERMVEKLNMTRHYN